MARIAIRPSNGDDIEKFLPLLAGAAKVVGGALARGAVMGGRGIASLAGKSSLGQGITAARGAKGASLGSKIMTGAKEAGKAHMKNKVGASDEDSASQIAGKFAMQRQQEQAQNRQQRLQNNMQNNLQMADRAKQNSDIKTGESMDMSWRLLKDWNWANGISDREKTAIIQTARKHQKKQKGNHVNIIPDKHHDKKFIEGHPEQRYKPNQKMPKGAEGLTPVDIGNAMAELYLSQHPELRQALGRLLPPPDKSKNLPDATPAMIFHALRTNDPIDKFDSYSPVVATHSGLNLPNVVSAVDTPAGTAKNRHTIRVSNLNHYNHTHPELRQNLPTIFNILSKIKNPSNLSEAQKIQSDFNYRTVKPEGTYLNAASQVYGKIGEDEAISNIIEEDKRRATEGRRMKTILDAAAKEKAKEDALRAKIQEKEQGELSVTQHEYMPGFYNVTDPAYPLQGTMMIGPFDNDKGQGYDYYHNHFLNQQNNVQTGEPMDLSWRMLKFDEDEWFRQHQAEQQRIAESAAQNRAEMRDETRSVPCSFCGAGIGEPCIGSPYRSHRARMLALGRKRMGDDIETGEPMDIAMRMLKEMSDDDIQNWVNYNLESQGILLPQEEKDEEVKPKFEMPTLYY